MVLSSARAHRVDTRPLTPEPPIVLGRPQGAAGPRLPAVVLRLTAWPRVSGADQSRNEHGGHGKVHQSRRCAGSEVLLSWARAGGEGTGVCMPRRACGHTVWEDGGAGYPDVSGTAGGPDSGCRRTRRCGSRGRPAQLLSTLDALGNELLSASLVRRYDPEASPDGDEGTKAPAPSAPSGT